MTMVHQALRSTRRALALSAILAASAPSLGYAADSYPWNNHAKPYDFLFNGGAHIDTHQQTLLKARRMNCQASSTSSSPVRRARTDIGWPRMRNAQQHAPVDCGPRLIGSIKPRFPEAMVKSAAAPWPHPTRPPPGGPVGESAKIG